MSVGTFTVGVAALDPLIKKRLSEKTTPALGLLRRAGARRALWPERGRNREVRLPCPSRDRPGTREEQRGPVGRDAARRETGGGQRPRRAWPARLSRCRW